MSLMPGTPIRTNKADRDAARVANKQRVGEIGRNLLSGKGAIGKEFHVTMKAFSAYVSEANAREIAKDPRVERVVAVMRTWETATQQNAPWHLDRIDQESWPLNKLYNYFSSGRIQTPNEQRVAALVVFVVDSGVRRTHAEFNGRVFQTLNFTGVPTGMSCPETRATAMEPGTGRSWLDSSAGRRTVSPRV